MWLADERMLARGRVFVDVAVGLCVRLVELVDASEERLGGVTGLPGCKISPRKFNSASTSIRVLLDLALLKLPHRSRISR